MTWQTYTRGFERAFPRGSTIRPVGAGVEVSIPCTSGHERTDHYAAARLPMDKLRSHLINKGWTFKGKKAVCPDCNQKDEKPMERVTSIDVPSAKPLQEQLQPVATNLARKARREAMQWLSEAFDPDKGKYSAGVSDATIAKETTLSEAAVAALREEFFGPIKEPAEIAAWRKEVASIREDVDKMKNEAADACTAILTRLNALDKLITGTIQRNGW